MAGEAPQDYDFTVSGSPDEPAPIAAHVPPGPVAAIDEPDEDTPEPAKADAKPDAASDAAKVLNEKKRTYKQRIAEVTWQKHEAERKAAALEQQLRERDAAKPAAEPAKPVPDTNRPRLKAFVDKIGSDYETYEDAVDAHADALIAYARQSDQTAQQQRLDQQTQRELFTKAQARIDAFKAKQPDFDPSLVASLIPRGAPSGPAVLDHFFFSEVGPELAHHLTLDPAELARIASLPYGFAIAALGRLEAKFDTRPETAPTGPAPTAPNYTPAKPPIKPVGSSPVTSDDDGDPDDLSEAAVNRHASRENAKIQAARRRR